MNKYDPLLSVVSPPISDLDLRDGSLVVTPSFHLSMMQDVSDVFVHCQRLPSAPYLRNFGF